MDEPQSRPGRTGPPARDEFDDMYTGTPPWDIGRPQPAFAALAEAGRVRGLVLDSGCGTGEHAIMAAKLDCGSVGVDMSPRAIERARAKVAGLDLPVTFLVGDVLDLYGVGVAGFDTVIDSGVFHVFGDADRAAYVASLHKVVKPGAHCLLMCFSEREPGGWGPRRVTREELRAAFATGWAEESIVESTFRVLRPQTLAPATAAAWLADFRRT